MSLALAIAASLPKATGRGRWFIPQELVMSVCSGESQDPPHSLIRSTRVSGASTFKSCTSATPTASCWFLSRPSYLGVMSPSFNGVALQAADLLGGIRLDVKVAVADLAVVVLPHSVVALADVLPIKGPNTLPGLVVGLDSRLYLIPRNPPDREERLIELDVLAARLLQLLEVLVYNLCQVHHHRAEVAPVVFVVGDLGQHVRAGHGDLYVVGVSGVFSYEIELFDQP